MTGAPPKNHGPSTASEKWSSGWAALASHRPHLSNVTIGPWRVAPGQPLIRVRKVIRTLVVMGLDFLAVTSTLVLVLYLIGLPVPVPLAAKASFLVLFGSIATACFFIVGLYRRNWRYLSFIDCVFLAGTIVLGLTVTWVSSLSLVPFRTLGLSIIPIAIIHWALLTVLMGTMRLARRGLREFKSAKASRFSRTANPDGSRRTILIGSPEWAKSMIELARADQTTNIEVVAVLLSVKDDTLSRIDSVPVLGSHELLQDSLSLLDDPRRKPQCVIVCDDGASLSHRDMARIVHRTRDLGLELNRVNDPWSQLLQRAPRIDMADLPDTELLGRDEYGMDRGYIMRQITGDCILVTGAGGTIGGELVRQLASFKPARIVLLDHCEYNLYVIELELREKYPDLDIQAEICNICQKEDVRRVFAAHRPTFVYHAAALKHVPIVEKNPCAGVHTNVIGSRIVAEAACEFSVKAMVQISTDKAVNPVGMMGATKRVGELYSQALDLCGVDDPQTPRFITVRFGNVLGSSGSIVPLFKRQLAEGRALTVTHPDIERFFMTVREAVQLILQGSARAVDMGTQRGNIFVLDMGAPVKIVDLARRMISLYGLEPDVDVPIEFIGLRPGEKLFEELFDTCEKRVVSGIPGIFEAHSAPIPLPLITKAIDQLAQAVAQGDHDEARRITLALVKVPNGTADMSVFTSETSLWGSPSVRSVRELN